MEHSAGLLVERLAPCDDPPDLSTVLQGKRSIVHEPMNSREDRFNCMQVIVDSARVPAGGLVLRRRRNKRGITAVRAKGSRDDAFNHAGKASGGRGKLPCSLKVPCRVPRECLLVGMLGLFVHLAHTVNLTLHNI